MEETALLGELVSPLSVPSEAPSDAVEGSVGMEVSEPETKQTTVIFMNIENK